MRTLILVALAAACAVDRPGPVVSVMFEQVDVAADQRDEVIAGASAWRDLGVDYAHLATDPICQVSWWTDQVALPCAMVVTIRFVPGAELGGAGLTADRLTMIQLELTGDQLAAVAAHEIGHSLWGPGHIAGPAIMSNPPTSLEPTAADRAHAHAVTNGWVPE